MLTQPLSWLKFIILSVLIFLFLISFNKPQLPIIVPIASSEPSPLPSPSPLLSFSPSPSPSPLPSPSPSPSPSPQPEYSQEEIHGFFEKYSSDYHVDINVLRHIAICESGFNPTAVNLYYSGLFQFSKNTWILYRNLLNEDPNPDLRINAKEAAKTGAYVLSINQAYIWPNCVPR